MAVLAVKSVTAGALMRMEMVSVGCVACVARVTSETLAAVSVDRIRFDHRSLSVSVSLAFRLFSLVGIGVGNSFATIAKLVSFCVNRFKLIGIAGLAVDMNNH